MQWSLTPNAAFPKITVPTLDGVEATLGQPNPARGDWKLVVVYRGKYCLICKSYLTRLSGRLVAFAAINVDVIAVSAD